MVIPCYNEEEVINETARRLKEKYDYLIKNNKISEKSRIVFINDGSKDNTWNIIEKLHNENKIYSGINLSRNKGHQNALLAGLITAKDFADITISMDADLQDDINVIDLMLEEYKKGNDIVYGARKKRDTDSIFKKTTAEGFYKITNALGGELIYNHADCRLMSKRAIEGLELFSEVNLFLRGIIPMIGYPSSIVYYDRAERFAGESKYPLKKMISFAVEGITSLSTKPIRIITLIGLTVSIISVIMAIYMIIRHFTGNTIVGWSSLFVSIWFLGGLQLLSIGIIGEYIGKIYLETKHRPKYIIERILNEKE